jgi:predicted  nucleic acid-binding Zn-ribbon protein
MSDPVVTPELGESGDNPLWIRLWSGQTVRDLEEDMAGGKQAIEDAVSSKVDAQVETIQLVGSGPFTYRGRCKICGWQSFQMSQTEASDMVKAHVPKHWRMLMQS